MSERVNVRDVGGRLWRSTGGELAMLLRSWWFGVDPRELAAPAAAPAEEEVVEDQAAEPVDRLELAQSVWGNGFLLPGGPDYVRSLVKPMGVNPAMSLLDLTAGLGGPSRQISQQYDVYITGLERNFDIAKRGHAVSVAAGLGRKVPINGYDPETFELRPHAFDGIYAQHLTCGVQDKERLIREVVRGLKARGQFTFVDFTLNDASLDDPRLAPWRKLERHPPFPWKLSQYIDCLTNAGLDCRIAEDQSELYRTMVISAWSKAIRTMDLKRMRRRDLFALLEEAELWVRRVSAIEKGALTVHRFYAVAQSAIT